MLASIPPRMTLLMGRPRSSGTKSLVTIVFPSSMHGVKRSSQSAPILGRHRAARRAGMMRDMKTSNPRCFAVWKIPWRGATQRPLFEERIEKLGLGSRAPHASLKSRAARWACA
jgi:hypothetical protein